MKLFILVSTCPVNREITVYRTLKEAEEIKAIMDERTCNANRYCLGERFHTIREVTISRKDFDAHVEEHGFDVGTNAVYIRGCFSELFPPVICARVKTFRKEAKLTQKEFADIVDIYPESVSYFERYKWGETSSSQLRKILDFFNCTYFILNLERGNFAILAYDGMDVGDESTGGFMDIADVRSGMHRRGDNENES